MQLRDARLCADCDEVHDAQQCPHCASERFSYLSRWVPLPAERVRARPTTSPEAEVYRQLIDADAGNSRGMWRHGLMSVAAVGMLGWLWRSASRARSPKDPQALSSDAENGQSPRAKPRDRESPSRRLE